MATIKTNKEVRPCSILQVQGGEIFRHNVYEYYSEQKKINNPHRFIEQQFAVIDYSMFLKFLRSTGKLKEIEINGALFTPDLISVKMDFGIELPDDPDFELRVSTGKNADKDFYTVPVKEEYREAQERKIKDIQRENKKVEAGQKQGKIKSTKIGLPISSSDIREYQYINGIRVSKKALGINRKGLPIGLVEEVDGKKQRVERDFDDSYIKYKKLYRSAGQAKSGVVIYIREGLWKEANEWLYAGLKVPKRSSSFVPKIVELSSYIALTCSSMTGEISLKPEEILILDDITTVVKKNAKVVVTDENGNAQVESIEDYKVKSTLFDGQALLESSVMDSATDLQGKPYNWQHHKKHGYILLRHFYFKAAAFRAYIQKYLKQYAEENGIDYDTWTTTDYFGNTIKMKEVKLITTINATKFVKFNEKEYGYDYSKWAEKVKEIPFGIVKCDHETKFFKGEEPTEDGGVRKVCYNQLSYQMVNTLITKGNKPMQPDILVASSEHFFRTMRKNNDYFVEVDKAQRGVSFITELYRKNPVAVSKTDLFRDYKTDQISLMQNKFYRGKVLISNADNCTIVGNPMAMLMYAASGSKEYALTDETLKSDNKSKYIGCYCTLFERDKELAAFRSPHCSINNCLALKNTNEERANQLNQYFPFGDNIIAVDLIETDFQERASGSDQDSDGIFTTDYTPIVESCQYSYSTFDCIVNGIEPGKVEYDSTPAEYARMDNTIQKSRCSTGQSSNNAGLATTKFFETGDEKYLDVAVMCSVLSQVSIDGAKKTFKVDLNQQLNRLSREYGLREDIPEYYQYNQEITELRKETKKEENAKQARRLDLQKQWVAKWRQENTTSDKKWSEIWEIIKEERKEEFRAELRRIENEVEEKLANECDRYLEEQSDEEEQEMASIMEAVKSLNTSPMEKLYKALDQKAFDFGLQEYVYRTKMADCLAKVNPKVEGKVDTNPNGKKKGQVERFGEVIAELDTTIKRHMAARTRLKDEEGIKQNYAMITYRRQMMENSLKHRIRNMNRPTMSKIIEKCLVGEYQYCRLTALRTLYNYDRQMFLSCFDFEKK